MKVAGYRVCGMHGTAVVVSVMLLFGVPRISCAQMTQASSLPSPEEVPPSVSVTSPVAASSMHHIPLKGQPTDDDRVRGSMRNGRVSLIARDATLNEVLANLAQIQGTNIVCAGQTDTVLTVTLNDLPFDAALDAIVTMAGCTWTRRGQVIYVTGLSATQKVAPGIQGRQIRIFPLDFLAAADVEAGIKTLLSPVGTSYILNRSPDDNRKTVESIVVEDVPQYLDRIDQYIREIDQPPRQVLIEVHVLQVELEEGCRHGVNFSHLMNISGHTMNLQVKGFAAASAPQAFFAELSADNLTGLLEALRTSTDAKTLAAPKVLALNGQRAQIQVGEKLGYRVLKTTQTSTLEDVQFLDVGVILEVTPTISYDNRILMNIHPKVSTGQIGETGLPEEKTSEVTTNVLLDNCEGVVIGGLIQEEQIDVQSKVIFLGDLYGIGPLFQRRRTSKVRKETIFFLLPRIIEPGEVVNPEEYERVQTPLFHGALCPNPRPWEPPLKNSYTNPTRLNLLRREHRAHQHVTARVVDEGANVTSDSSAILPVSNQTAAPTPREVLQTRIRTISSRRRKPIDLRR